MEDDTGTALGQVEPIAGARETWKGNGCHGWRGRGTDHKPLAWIDHPKAPEAREGRGLTLDEILESNDRDCHFRQVGQEAPSDKLTYEQRPD